MTAGNQEGPQRPSMDTMAVFTEGLFYARRVSSGAS